MRGVRTTLFVLKRWVDMRPGIQEWSVGTVHLLKETVGTVHLLKEKW